MGGRVLDRKKRRLPCEIRFGSQRFSGVVIDVSASGVFIQTSAKVEPGDALEVELSVPGSDEPVIMAVEVVRWKRVPAQLRSVAQGGIGVRITNAPEAYYNFMQRLETGAGGLSAGPSQLESPGQGRAERAYLVRVKQSRGPRSKRLFVEAEDEATAREVALKQLDEGWQVLEVSVAAR